jgi:diaminopimelate epimerase
MIDFFKMEGAGNDYVYIDLRKKTDQIFRLNRDVLPRLCDRRYGVGSDGLVLIGPSERAAGRMWMWNADGSSSAMCGNALRCVALYLSVDTKRKDLLVESGAGLHHAEIISQNGDLISGTVRLDMGRPIFDAARIPYIPESHLRHDPVFRYRHGIAGAEDGYVISMGNPHCVIFVDDPDDIDIESTGSEIERDPSFPERTNVEFVSIREDGSLYQRTWERGSGETLACGSGACASLVAAAKAGLSDRVNTVHLRGGDLIIEWNDTVLMTGPARLVYRGELDEREFSLFS